VTLKTPLSKDFTFLCCFLGEIDVLWCFNEQAVIDKFVTTCDSDHNEGFSSCSLEMSKAGRALFHGNLDLRVPKDGRIKKAGYCAMRSQRIRVRKSYRTISLALRPPFAFFIFLLICILIVGY
jgi:hypothetical protein